MRKRRGLKSFLPAYCIIISDGMVCRQTRVVSFLPVFDRDSVSKMICGVIGRWPCCEFQPRFNGGLRWARECVRIAVIFSYSSCLVS